MGILGDFIGDLQQIAQQTAEDVKEGFGTVAEGLVEIGGDIQAGCLEVVEAVSELGEDITQEVVELHQEYEELYAEIQAELKRQQEEAAKTESSVDGPREIPIDGDSATPEVKSNSDAGTNVKQNTSPSKEVPQSKVSESDSWSSPCANDSTPFKADDVDLDEDPWA